jgi:hypothetical protein
MREQREEKRDKRREAACLLENERSTLRKAKWKR